MLIVKTKHSEIYNLERKVVHEYILQRWFCPWLVCIPFDTFCWCSYISFIITIMISVTFFFLHLTITGSY